MRCQGAVERGGAVVVESGRDGAEYRHGVGRDAEGLAVALELLGHIAKGVLGAAAVELVDRHEIGEIQHVDLLELARGAELGRHHIESRVHQRHDRGIALPDAGGLDDHQVESRHLAGIDDLGKTGGNFGARLAGRQRPEIDVRMVVGVHADAITEQGTAGLPAGRIDRDHGDLQPFLLIQTQTPQQFISKRRLTCAARTRDAEHRHRSQLPRTFGDFGGQFRREGLVLQGGDRPGQGAPVATSQRVDRQGRFGREIPVGPPHHVLDHSHQTQLGAVLRGVEPFDAVGVEFSHLGRDNHTAATAKHLHRARPAGFQQVDHVLEVLHVPALIGRDGDAVGVLLDGSRDDLAHGPVVPEMDHLGAIALEKTTDDVDGRVVAVEQARCSDETQAVTGLEAGAGGAVAGEVGHGIARKFGEGSRAILAPDTAGLHYRRSSS